MEFRVFKTLLTDNPDSTLSFRFASGEHLPAHFHVTEVGKVSKEFIDCGGTRRSNVSCVLQTLVANDVDHRLTAGKLAKILQQAEPLELADDLPVEAEVQTETIGIFDIFGGDVDNEQLVFLLGSKQTACLAPDRCGLEVLSSDDGSCCGDSGCC